MGAKPRSRHPRRPPARPVHPASTVHQPDPRPSSRSSTESLLALLDEDIEDICPASGDRACSLSLANPDAPIVSIIRSPGGQGGTVPVIFVESADPEKTYSLLAGINQGTKGKAPLAHCIEIEGRVGRSVLIVPFLFHMFADSRAFIEAVTQYVQAGQGSARVVYRIVACHLTVTHRGKQHHSDRMTSTPTKAVAPEQGSEGSRMSTLSRTLRFLRSMFA